MSIDPILTQAQSLWWDELGSSSTSAASFWDTESTENTGALSSQFQVIGDQLRQLKSEIAAKVASTELEQNAKERTDEFAEELRAGLEEAGIDMGESVTLTLDDTGLVRVNGEHESKEEIEKFFLKSSEWSEKYADVHLRNDLARQMKMGTLASNANNPYLKNMLAWESVAITVTSDGASVSTF